MSDLTIEVVTTRSSMEEIRPAIDAGLKEAFPGGMLKWRWEGDVLHLSGPGAKGTVVLEDGRLVGRAHLGPPASMMRPIIEQKIRAVRGATAGRRIRRGPAPRQTAPSAVGPSGQSGQVAFRRCPRT